MIISHAHEFIFLKPRKVAGTSVEVALAEHCGPDDIITPITGFSSAVDEEYYEQPARNYEEAGFYNHMLPADIRRRIEPSVWDEYLKVTIVRNPWDRLVSQFRWQQSHKLTEGEEGLDRIAAKLRRNAGSWEDLRYNIRKRWMKWNEHITPERDFEAFVRNLRPKYSNTPFYFDANGNTVADHVMRYEDLAKEYEGVCEKIGIPYKELPTLKTKPRKSGSGKKPHYSTMFTDELRDVVARDFAVEIDAFGYEFEDKR